MTVPESFTLHGDHVTLGQLLKLTGIIGSGGEAKLYLLRAGVRVNGQLETRRGRKLRAGDLVEAPDSAPITITIGVHEPVQEHEVRAREKV